MTTNLLLEAYAKRPMKLYMTEKQLKACLNRAIKRSARMLREAEEEEFDADTNWREEFMNWVLDGDADDFMGENDTQSSTDKVGLMHEYYADDNDDSFNELIEEFGDEIGKDLTDDSQESNWIIEEIRRAINEWGYYNCNEDNKEYDEEEDL